MKITIAILIALLTIGVNANLGNFEGIQPFEGAKFEEIQPFDGGKFEEIQPFVDSKYEDIQPFGALTNRQSVIIFINRIRKEIEGLIEEYNQCDSYESDALKGTCFTHWSLRLVSDIKQFIEAIKNWSDEELPETRSTVILINKIRKEIKGLIEEFEQCDAYESDALKGTCFTHWSLRIANDIKQLIEYIQSATKQTRGKTDNIILVNNIRKEAKLLQESFQQCKTYRNPMKKARCIGDWAKVALADLYSLTKIILNLATPCQQKGTGLDITTDIVCTLLLVKTDVQDLIDLFNECSNQKTDVAKGFCFTRFGLTIVADVYELIVTIIGFFQPSTADFAWIDSESEKILNFYAAN